MVDMLFKALETHLLKGVFGALRDARNTIDVIEKTITDRWYDIARRVGVTEKDCEGIADAFVYPGFRLETTAQ